jgi:hypothetical protein
MKKVLKTALILLCLCTVLATAAMASNYDSFADDLNALGLFKGTESGYALDDAPNRVQAGVMLVRLLGKEAEALAGEYEHPFSDVPEWADKYVGYLYENNLTNGVSETEFGTESPCTAAMYTTFVLRALGYSDKAGGDFAYNDALTFGEKAGIYVSAAAGDEFLRDDMVFISYLGLSAATKADPAVTLLARLVSEGAVTADAAAPILERFSSIKALSDASQAVTQQSKFEVTNKLLIKTTALFQTAEVELNTASKYNIDADSLKLHIQQKVTANGETSEANSYYKDGFLYTNADGVKSKTAIASSALLPQTDTADFGGFSSFKSVTASKEGDYTVYTIEYNLATPAALMSQLFGEDSSLFEGIDYAGVVFNKLTSKIYLDSKGAYVKDTTTGKLTTTIAAGESSIVMTMDMDISSELTASGDSVVITYPADLDTYAEIKE